MSTERERRSHQVELAAAVLVALATVSSAWCAYQAVRWSGVQTMFYSAANAARTESNRQSAHADQRTAIDVGASATHGPVLADIHQPS